MSKAFPKVTGSTVNSMGVTQPRVRQAALRHTSKAPALGASVIGRAPTLGLNK